ncbi:MAG: tRNA (adenosine(37)-N6)-dimethylallyltransferase MiaA [Clostridia bacterium]|nr:tRNA (adenosine(37)-N6)-dimethylallyltransferase MiaA [Clostridia bacterium]
MIRALALTGPTASGKTALSLALAERLSCEIISSDSMQIYRYMDIGTAKATPEERSRVPHHVIDMLEPSVRYSTEDYRRDALAAARDIVDRGRLPLFVGGTGLYIDTLRRAEPVGSPPSDEALRERLMNEGRDDEGKQRLWQRLYEVDPASAEKTHKNNLRRVVRALEIYELSGRTKSYFDALSKDLVPDIAIDMITLDFHNRDNLYERVDKRVDIMMSEGLLDEVRGLHSRGLLMPEYTSYQAIGYKELREYLEGECDLASAIENIKLSSRRYAKRQLTWFRHTDAVHLFVDTEDGRMKGADELLSECVEIAEGLALRMNGDSDV